jgi:hypothetical protein
MVQDNCATAQRIAARAAAFQLRKKSKKQAEVGIFL